MKHGDRCPHCGGFAYVTIRRESPGEGARCLNHARVVCSDCGRVSNVETHIVKDIAINRALEDFDTAPPTSTVKPCPCCELTGECRADCPDCGGEGIVKVKWTTIDASHVFGEPLLMHHLRQEHARHDFAREFHCHVDFEVDFEKEEGGAGPLPSERSLSERFTSMFGEWPEEKEGTDG
jgi:hypothetical protein